MLLMRVRARARRRAGGGGGEGGVGKAGERETERRRGQRHGKEKTVPRFKVSCFGGRGPARAARPEILLRRRPEASKAIPGTTRVKRSVNARSLGTSRCPI